MKKLLYLFLVFLCYEGLGQGLVVYDVDATAFPTVKAKFFAFDANGKQITNLSPSDFEVKENGQTRNVTYVSCPPPKPPQALSSVLVMDVSGSMGIGPFYYINLAKEGARSWVEALPLGTSECAITAFDDKNYMIQDLTTDKNKLFFAVDRLGSTGGGTDYDAALLNPMAGGILVAKNGKYKRVIVFLSDGLPNQEPQKAKIIQEALIHNITIYAVILGMPCPQCIKDITTQTGGLCFDNVTSEEQIRQIYLQILMIAEGNFPCEINWERDARCVEGNTKVEVELLQNRIKANTYYQITDSLTAKLEFTPQSVKFINPIVGVKKDTTVRVTAKNGDFVVTNIQSSDPSFIISPNSFTLSNGESIVLTVSYFPIDSNYRFCTFEFENNLCPTNYYASGGWRGKKSVNPTLRVVHPNGGEKFAVGSDTVIRWEGVSPFDTVAISYSIDNGKSWKLLTNKATNLEYRWKNIPRPPSTQCLVEVSQKDFGRNPSSGDTAIRVVWQKTLGGSDYDRAYSIIESKDGDYVVVGWTKSKDGDVENHFGEDAWIVKINPDNGAIIWQKTLEEFAINRATDVIESSDGAYVVAGYTQTYEKTYNYIIAKLRAKDGSVILERNLGGSDDEMASSIIESSDGAYVVAGYAFSNDGTVSGNKGLSDYWIVKLKATDLSVIWGKTLGGSQDDVATSIIESSDGAYVVAGWTNSFDGDVSENKGFADFWVVKLNPENGSIIWEKSLGGSFDDKLYSIIESSDRAYVLAGSTSSNDGDLSSNKGGWDFWVVKINPEDGSIIWQKTLGGSGDDIASSIIESTDGTYVVAGYSESNDGDVMVNKGGWDFWVVKLNPEDGSIIWQKTIGGSGSDWASSIVESQDLAYVVAGFTMSNDGDVSGLKGNEDYWIVKLSEGNILQSDVSDSVFAIVEPHCTARDIDMKECLVGSVKDSVVAPFIQNIDNWAVRIDSIYFRGADAAAFDIVSGIPPYEVPPNGGHHCEFRFKPTRTGKHTAEVVIITQSDTLVQNIIGEGVEPQIAVLSDIIDFGKVPVGSNKDTLQVATIKNIGTAPLTITSTRHNKPNDKDFMTLAGGGAFTLQPNETRLMDLRFKPSDVGRTSGTLEFYYNGVGSPAVIQLFGEGISLGPARATLSVGSLEGYPGEIIEVPIILSNEEYLEYSGATSIRVELSYNPTLLWSMDYPQTLVNERTAKITLENLPVDVAAGEPLAKVRFKVGLGNDTTCDLVLSDAVAENGMVDISLINGKFRLLGVCREGGTRLVNPKTRAGIISIMPNPAEERMEIEITVTEVGTTELVLYDMMGNKVKTLYQRITTAEDFASSTKDIHTSVDIRDVGTGQYILILKTPTYTEARQVMIVR